MEGRNIPHQVVTRHGEHYRVVLAAVSHFEEAQRSQGEGRSGVATLRLNDDAQWRYADRPKLVDCEEAVGLVADDEWHLYGCQSVEAAHGLLEHALVVDDGEELLGVLLAGQTAKDASPILRPLSRGTKSRRDLHP